MGNEIDNNAGDFYTIYFVRENNFEEKVTMEKINSEYKLLGYECALPNKNK